MGSCSNRQQGEQTANMPTFVQPHPRRPLVKIATEGDSTGHFPVPITPVGISLCGRQGFAWAPDLPAPLTQKEIEVRAHACNVIADLGPHLSVGLESPTVNADTDASGKEEET